jgi:hypothetical protein
MIWNICYAMPCGAAQTARLNMAQVYTTLHMRIVAEPTVRLSTAGDRQHL